MFQGIAVNPDNLSKNLSLSIQLDFACPTYPLPLKYSVIFCDKITFDL